MTKLLIVEDDENLGSEIEHYLRNEGFDVTWAKNLEEARSRTLDDFQCLILDWMLPDGQGLDFLKEIRNQNIDTPVIMLTARAELIDKVLGLESGANDYMTKPFEPRELVARLRVQLRIPQASITQTTERNFGDLEIDFEMRKVLYKGESVSLTKMEYELLRLLVESPGAPFTREEILNKVWGYDSFPTTRTVDTHILQLRQKLSDGYFETVRGVGYRFNPPKN